MSDWNRVTRDDLLRWADQEDSSMRLPELLRRLIAETTPDLEWFDFPGGSAVTSGGFDGEVLNGSLTPFVPEGRSVWELSVNQSPGKKADSDYQKRTEKRGDDAREVTYIQVSVRPWQNAKSWSKSRESEGKWGAVRAYGVDALTAWLEQAPIARTWVQGLLGRDFGGAVTAAEWWERWASATEPQLTTEFVLARPTEELAALAERLVQPGLTTISASSEPREPSLGAAELIACVVALSLQRRISDQESGARRGNSESGLADRMVVVETKEALAALLDSQQHLVLVLQDQGLAAQVPGATAHSVVVPMPGKVSAGIGIKGLDPLKMSSFLEGTKRTDHSGLATIARHSLQALRLRLAKQPELMRPEWARSPVARLTRTVILLLEWDGVHAGDLEIVEALAGKDYDDVLEGLRTLQPTDNPLVANLEKKWRVVSPYDAWFLLHTELTEDDLERFANFAQAVLETVDPVLDLEPAYRWRAPFEGIKSKYSESMRRGIMRSLALLATVGDQRLPILGSARVDSIIRRVLATANTGQDSKLWKSLAGELPMMAEASPDEFISAVQEGLGGEEPLLAQLFETDNGDSWGLGTDSTHIWLIWAIERLAWSEDYFGAAIDLLVRLAEIEPKGPDHSGCLGSLANIFCLWWPSTGVSSTLRSKAINRMVAQSPDIAWRLITDLLNQRVQAGGTDKPEMRHWGNKRSPSERQKPEGLEDLTDRALALAGRNGSRWVALVDLHGGNSLLTGCFRCREAIRKGLSGIRLELCEDKSIEVWEAMRSQVYFHSRIQSEQRALPRTERTALAAVLEEYRPAKALNRYRWLFKNPEVALNLPLKATTFAERQQEKERRIFYALADIVEEAGIEGVFDTARSGHAEFVGWSLARAVGQALGGKLIEYLGEESIKGQVANGYFQRALFEQELSSAEQWLRHPGVTSRGQAQVLLSLRTFPEPMEKAEQLGDAVLEHYWRNFHYSGWGHDFPHVEVVARGLGEAGRWGDAIQFLSSYRKGFLGGTMVSVALDCFEGWLAAGEPQLERWDIEPLLEYLFETAEAGQAKKLLQIEFALLPSIPFDPPLHALYRLLSTSPESFVEMLSWAFPEKRSSEWTTAERRKAEVASRLLTFSWKRPPGMNDAGQFDAQACDTWLTQALELLADKDLVPQGKTYFGHVLFHTPSNVDGWPTDEVAALLDKFGDKYVSNGLQSEMINSRGARSVGPTEGGEKNRESADERRQAAERFSASYPGAAKILREMARQCDEHAGFDDLLAQRRMGGFVD